MDAEFTGPSDVVRWLEAEGWDVLPGDGLRARRDRGERTETLHAAVGWLRYTVTRAVGEEDAARAEDDAGRYRAVSRTYRETTVTAECEDGALRRAIESATMLARSLR